MDVSVYLRVFGRFWQLLAFGLVLATALAFFSYVRIEFDGALPDVKHRSDETWISASTLFVTQEGFPWGRSILDETLRVPGQDGAPSYVPRYGDPGRYSGLAQLYAVLAKSDAVRRMVMKGAPPGARYQPDVVRSPDNSAVLPLIYMNGYGTTPAIAEQMADRAADAFGTYLRQEQARNRIPEAKRVEVVVTSRASSAELFEARSVVRPIFVFLLAFLAFVALAFVLENVRPAPRVGGQLRAAGADEPASQAAPFRTSA
jgi:hypothetical protein